jgi:hypothetical protein
MTSRKQTTPAPAAEPSSKHPAGAGVDYFGAVRERRDELVAALCDRGATAVRTLADIDAAIATADSALALLALEVARQRGVAARRAAHAAAEAKRKREAAALAYVERLQKDAARTPHGKQ